MFESQGSMFQVSNYAMTARLLKVKPGPLCDGCDSGNGNAKQKWVRCAREVMTLSNTLAAQQRRSYNETRDSNKQMENAFQGFEFAVNGKNSI